MNLSKVLYGPRVIFTKSRAGRSVCVCGWVDGWMEWSGVGGGAFVRSFVHSLVGGLHTVV